MLVCVGQDVTKVLALQRYTESLFEQTVAPMCVVKCDDGKIILWNNAMAEVTKVAETDAILGIVIDAAKQTSTWDRTFVIFLSDHGENNMEHRQIWKNSMYEASERVPMIIAGVYPVPSHQPPFPRSFRKRNGRTILPG